MSGHNDSYVTCTSTCHVCKQVFCFNPVKVPSFRDDSGNRQPICRLCIEVVNAKRQKIFLEPFEIHPDAYEPCMESDL